MRQVPLEEGFERSIAKITGEALRVKIAQLKLSVFKVLWKEIIYPYGESYITLCPNERKLKSMRTTCFD